MPGCGEVNGQVVILGKKGHAEVVGLAGHADGRAIIVEAPEDLEALDYARPIYFLSQTTQSLELFGRMAQTIRERSLHPEQVTVRDTICRQVSGREAHLREFAARFDVVIFVSGRKSSNGKVLYGVCREANPRQLPRRGGGRAADRMAGRLPFGRHLRRDLHAALADGAGGGPGRRTGRKREIVTTFEKHSNENRTIYPPGGGLLH